MFVKFYLKRYKMSSAFKKEFNSFLQQLQNRNAETFEKCDLELVALTSKRDYRKELGTALVTQFLLRAKYDRANCIRLFTNTLASWEFYEKRGFKKVVEFLFQDGSKNKSLVYEYILKEH